MGLQDFEMKGFIFTKNHSWQGYSLLFFILCFTSAANARSDTFTEKEIPLKLGFFPIISTVALFKRFSPLRDYLSDSLGRKVILLTAKDFPTFYRRTAQRDYDIVVTAPHFAVSAADSGRYRIRATSTKDVQQLIVVKINSQYTSVKQLAGKTIATPPEHALMTMMGKQFLVDAGLTGNDSPSYRAFISHNAANQALLGDEVDAAIASSNTIMKAIKRGEPLKIIGRGLKLPNMATLVATDQDPMIGELLVEILTGMNESENGRYVLQRIDIPGYRAVS